jgi:hypothetical protein
MYMITNNICWSGYYFLFLFFLRAAFNAHALETTWGAQKVTEWQLNEYRSLFVWYYTDNLLIYNHWVYQNFFCFNEFFFH